MTTDPTAGGTTDPAQTQQQQIDAALTQAEQAVADLTQRVSTDLQNLRDEVAKADAQGTVDITEIVNRIDQIVINVQSVDAAVVVSTPTPAAPTTTDPAGTPVDPTTTGTSGTTATASAPDQPVYTTSEGERAVDTSVWPPAPFTTPDGQQLYYYSGDHAGSTTATGDGLDGVWHEYTGPTQPANAEPTTGSQGETAEHMGGGPSAGQ